MSREKAVGAGANSFQRVVYALIVANSLSLLLYAFRVADSHTLRYWFLFWNLALAWIPIGLAWWVMRRLSTTPWLSAENILLTALWLIFLPNSFYLISDLVHLRNTGEVNLLYDAALFFSIIFNGLISGFVSIYIVHRELLKRLERFRAHALIAVVILLCSFAIYLGRNLRWNTWDVIVNPAGLLFDVSDRLIYPIVHLQTFVTTAIFFLLVGGMYVVIWQLIVALNNDKH